MDTSTPYLETTCSTPYASLIGGHFPQGELGLGESTPSKSDVVTILDSFIFYKTKGRVVKQSYKKIKLPEIHKLMVSTSETPLMANTRTNLISITSTGVDF